MRMRALGLMGVMALFVVAGKPQAQPVADDPVIPLPIIEDNGPQAEVLLAKAEVPAEASIVSKAGAGATVVPIVPATQPASAAHRTIHSGTVKLPSTAFQVCYLFHYDKAAGESATQAGPVSLVLWKAVGEGTKFDVDELRERISLHPGAPSLTGEGTYTLQPDYQVKKLSLSRADASHLAELLLEGDGQALVADPVYKAKVASNLKEVEWSVERSKELRKLAAQKAREARKTKSNSSKTKVATAQASSPTKTKKPAATKTGSPKTSTAKAKPFKAGKTLARHR